MYKYYFTCYIIFYIYYVFRCHEFIQHRKTTSKFIQNPKQLQNEFTDVNLFNAKLIYANKVPRTPGLTKDQKHGIVERFDDASTINFYAPCLMTSSNSSHSLKYSFPVLTNPSTISPT